MESVISLQEVSKVYRRGEREVRALDSVSLSVEKGEFLAVVGSSGSGKTTLMNLMGCLDTPTSGTCLFEGEDVGQLSGQRLAAIRNSRIGFVFQGFNLIGGLTALENVELPLAYRGVPASERRALAREALSLDGLVERTVHLPGQQSGGQQQRVAVARAIAARPPVILADEPTGNLDPASGKAVMEILNRLHREGRTLVLITHDMALAATAQRRVHIREGHLRREEEHEFPFGDEGKFGGFRPSLAIDNPPADDIISS